MSADIELSFETDLFIAIF